jgi:hypothetical protein
VYQALTQQPHSQSLEVVVEGCCAHGYKQLMKYPPPRVTCGHRFFGT